MFDWAGSIEGWASLLALSSMEVLLSIDNILVMGVILAGLPRRIVASALLFGLALALVFRLLILSGVAALLALDQPVLTIFGETLSWKEITLFLGAFFLIIKAVHELHVQVEWTIADEAEEDHGARLLPAIIEIAAMNLVFSIDSIVVALGVSGDVAVMGVAAVIGVLAMYFFSRSIAGSMNRHPTIRTLALAFVLLIGVMLCLEALHQPVPRGYLYAAMAFAFFVELVIILAASGRQKTRKPARPKVLTDRMR